MFGIVAAAGVGYLTSQNPNAQPAGVAVLIRVLIIGTLTATAVYAQSSRLQGRMALLLAGSCAFSALWLLNGSSTPFAFSIGVLLSAPAVVLAYYVMLVHPSGTLRSRQEIRFVTLLGGAAVLMWTVATLISTQPPLPTPSLACGGRCPRNAFYVGFTINGVLPALKIGLRLVWLAITLGATLLLERRWRSASGALRGPLMALWMISCLAAVLLLTYFVAQRSGPAGLANAVGAGYVSVWAVIPVAILAGLAAERLFMGQALARFVSRLAHDGETDPGALLAATLQHPSLSIVYRRPATGAYVDFSGAAVADPGSVPGRDVAWIERDGHPVAAVSYDSDLTDHRRFIRAAGDAALMRLEQAQLSADLRASTADLTASRLRLVETAQTERQRIERDLHDGIQQDLLGARLRLDLASETVRNDPASGQRMIAAVGTQLDQILDSLRALARGIYPSLLRDHGLVEALRSAARRSPIPVSIRAARIGRFTEDVEVAVYFCCLEGLQNIAKHAGSSAQSAIRFWHDGGALRFEIADDGDGFDPASQQTGNGLANMHDRIEAVGGTLTITSRKGEGTVVRGRVPVESAVTPG